MHLRMGLSDKPIFGVFRSQGTCLVAVNVVLANSTPLNPLGGFDGPL